MKIRIGGLSFDLSSLRSKCKISVNKRTVKIDGKTVASDVDGDTVKVVVEGGVADIQANEVEVHGDVHGDVDCNSLECGDIQGDVDANSVICKKIVGDVDANSVLS